MHRSVPVHYNCMTVYGVTTCLENLEMLLRKFASVQGNVNKSHGSVEKKTCRGYWSETSYLHLFFTLLSLCISFWFRIMHCSIPIPITDNNTSTSTIWVTLNMGKSAKNRHGNVMECHTVWREVTLNLKISWSGLGIGLISTITSLFSGYQYQSVSLPTSV